MLRSIGSTSSVPAASTSTTFAGAADASDEEIDTFIGRLRVEQCDLVNVLSTAAWVAAERARLAHQRGIALPVAAWATAKEIAEDRGAPLDLV
jgi:hypothetical protein